MKFEKTIDSELVNMDLELFGAALKFRKKFLTLLIIKLKT